MAQSTQANPLQRAVDAANRGQIGQALKRVRSVLKQQPENFDARHLLGVLELKRSHYADAARALARAVSLKPDHAGAQSNLALARRCHGELEAAREPARQAHELEPARAEFAINYADLLVDLEAYDTVIAVCRAALARHDGYRLYYALGQAQLRKGDYEDAIATFQACLQRSPNDTEALLELGLARGGTGDRDGAIRAHHAVLEQQPDHEGAWHNLVHVLETDDERIGELLRERVKRVPGHGAAWADLAAFEERRQHLDPAEEALAEALRLDSRHIWANLTAVRLDRRRRRYEQALDRLDRLARRSDAPPQPIRFERAFALDALGGREGEAWQALTEANAMVQSMTALDLDRFPQRRVDPAERFTSDWIAQWSSLPEEPDESAPIFLGGFPRSGTTLLGNMLHGHPDLYDLEERPIIAPVLNWLCRTEAGYPEALASLTKEDKRELQSRYQQALKHAAPDVGDATVINRNPIAPVDAGLIHRVFPKARFIFIMRDPADVCLSCLMQPFQQNPMTVQFTSIERTVWFYDRCMRAWETYRTQLPLNAHVVRYEDLTAEPGSVLGGLLDFLNVRWDDRVLKHTETAQSRVVRTASSSQVREPLYQRATRRWERYAPQMGEALAALEPWRRHFGYDQGGY
jgi:tetratricopeptide (TPR) repeat protein